MNSILQFLILNCYPLCYPHIWYLLDEANLLMGSNSWNCHCGIYLLTIVCETSMFAASSWCLLKTTTYNSSLLILYWFPVRHFCRFSNNSPNVAIYLHSETCRFFLSFFFGVFIEHCNKLCGNNTAFELAKRDRIQTLVSACSIPVRSLN